MPGESEEYLSSLIPFRNVLRLIVEHLTADVGFSLIRLGDGERELLVSQREGKPVGRIATGHWQLSRLPLGNWEYAANSLIWAVRNADVVGLPLRAFEPDAAPMFGVPQELVNHRIDWRDLDICDVNISHRLVKDFLKELIESLNGRKTAIVYSEADKAAETLRSYGMIGAYGVYYNGVPHNGNVTEQIVSDGARAAIIAAGPLGKSLAVLLAQRGLVALDIGSCIQMFA